nr:hypothetical protein [Teredinibacter turnerae]
MYLNFPDIERFSSLKAF